jgi:hypothetical protein
MKKIIYISAWLFSFLFVIGFLFTILRLPYGFYLLYGGGTIAGLICYPLLFFYKWREHKLTETRLLYQWILGQSAVALFVISTWLRFGYDFAANIAFIISFAILAFAFLPLLFLNMYKESLKEI